MLYPPPVDMIIALTPTLALVIVLGTVWKNLLLLIVHALLPVLAETPIEVWVLLK
jgi:hypothetical protein